MVRSVARNDGLQSLKGDRKSIEAGSRAPKHSVDALTPPNQRHSGAAVNCSLCKGPCKNQQAVNGEKPRRLGLFKKVAFVKAKKIGSLSAGVKRQLKFDDSLGKDDGEPGKKKKRFCSTMKIARNQIVKLGNGKL